MRIYQTENIVIGTGCAGFNAADWLVALGQKDTIILTEGISMGTSRNTGSDKQTYYKLSVAGDQKDSVQEMAETLFSGGGVMGDIALCEAAGSLQGFYKLAGLGVPFPSNEYGEYAGYKTDHDPRARATSAGPLTSKFMTEVLERAVRQKRIPIHDHTQVLRIVTDEGRACGVLAMDTVTGERVAYRCRNVIAATGGPAMAYETRVFPQSQKGMTGALLLAGAKGRNLNEWQYGLASLKFRWNVSGTYQQVLPRYIAIDASGRERELFSDFFAQPFEAIDRVFLKGYQWPFDVRKTDGSSQIDLIVHHAVYRLGWRVYMDFTRNPSCIDEHGFDPLCEEAKQYLKNSGALFGTPIERLQHMNPGAIALYGGHGIDLTREKLEVAVCAQHMNGGIAVDCHWQTDIEGLYVCGEAAGTFGAYRPGGSALNATQVGSRRAAEAVAYGQKKEPIGEARFRELAERALAALPSPRMADASNLDARILEAQRAMSASAAHVRDLSAMNETARMIRSRIQEDGVRLCNESELPRYYQYRDTLITQYAMLSAMAASAERCGSRASALVLDEKGVEPPVLRGQYRMRPARRAAANEALISQLGPDGEVRSHFEPVTPIPQRDEWFENVWRGYRERTHQ